MDILVKIHNSYDSNNPMFACYQDDWQRDPIGLSHGMKHYPFPMQSSCWYVGKPSQVILQNIMQQYRVLIHRFSLP